MVYSVVETYVYIYTVNNTQKKIHLIFMDASTSTISPCQQPAEEAPWSLECQ